MRFLVDQNLEPDVSLLLREVGHESVHASEIGKSVALDIELLEICRRENRTLVTADKNLTKYLADIGAATPSVITLRGYGFGSRRSPKLELDLINALPEVQRQTIESSCYAFTLQIDRPLRVRRLPFPKLNVVP